MTGLASTHRLGQLLAVRAGEARATGDAATVACSRRPAHAASEIIYLGLDVHKDSLTIAVLPAGARTPTRVERLPNDLRLLKRFVDRLASHAQG
jgi:hypothetical protein